MSVHDETNIRPICDFCKLEIPYGQKERHRKGICKRIVHNKKARYDVYIGRPSIFGNPFEIGKNYTREQAIQKFEESAPNNPELLKELYKLDDVVLGCWCDFPNQDCHGRILLRLREEQKLENKKTPKEEYWLKGVLDDVKKKRVAVVGSRNYNNRAEIYKYLESKLDKVEYFVSGGCQSGADKITDDFCRERGLDILNCWPKWKNDDGTTNRGAGFARNRRIVERADIIVAFWTGSKGTKNTIDLAQKLGKKVIIHNVRPDKSPEPKICPQEDVEHYS